MGFFNKAKQVAVNGVVTVVMGGSAGGLGWFVADEAQEEPFIALGIGLAIGVVVGAISFATMLTLQSALNGACDKAEETLESPSPA